MLLASLNAPDSAYYWAFVAAITLVFAVIDLEALRRRSMSRFHGFSVAVYVTAFVIVLGLTFTQLGNLWWVFPAAVRVAVAAMFYGGQLLAAAVRREQWIAHPERREPRFRLRKVSEGELRAGEEYDAQWQAEDRERNREHELHAREERAHRRRRLTIRHRV